VAERWGLTLPLPGLSLAAHEELVKRAEAVGYTDLWSGETNGPDGFTPLALSAAWTQSVRLGTGVVGVFQRGPALLAQEAAALADASGGRFVLGIGSGWFQKDYDEYGYDFGTAGSRLRDLDRALPLIKERWAKLNPPPLHRIPILIGGSGEKVTLRIVAEHADEWHTFGTPETLRHKTAVLDEWCAKVGRDPAEIVRSTTISRLTGETNDPGPLLELGFTDFVVSVQGPDWDLAPLRKAIAWRDTLN
jgi:alkanesulfonate monooxygenase SsuD/methylene tetrahydromethanopterin reductase-like flavin-dependent oxidoreductase (luciferase family)